MKTWVRNSPGNESKALQTLCKCSATKLQHHSPFTIS